ncbi:MAG: dihydrolipoyllysine-residue succinyltransferase [Buchnera aphidicola (Nurudea yanoniella)]
MNTANILVPNLPESVTEATIATWHKKPGDHIKEGEVLVDIETDKVVLEIPSLFDGQLKNIISRNGEKIVSGQIIGILVKSNLETTHLTSKNTNQELETENKKLVSSHERISPMIRRLISEHNLQKTYIQGTGEKGRITREDVMIHVNSNQTNNILDYIDKNKSIEKCHDKRIERVKMTTLRKKISEKLLETKHNSASLTTFNEVNMTQILKLRKKYGELFEKKYKIKLGLMSFYIKAVIEALKSFPNLNASIEKDDIIYYKYFNINIAISTPRGLVAPILKNVDLMSMSDIERTIRELAIKGKNSKLTINDLKEGNFTITNGGVFGSLFSTPIINPPQSAILGIHVIKERPMVVNGNIKILPMMYLALTYDHRLIDGKESVGFLLRIKELLEDFNRISLSI